MGKGRTRLEHHRDPKLHALPPSPSHSFSSSSSSDFEFTISVSPRKSSNALCPADELFYKGQLLPLHLSPRLSMVRTLLFASSSNSSSSDASTSTTTASRDSSGSSNDSQYSSFNSELVLLAESCDSSRRASSVTEDQELKRLTTSSSQINLKGQIKNNNSNKSTNKYFSLSRFSSVFKKEAKQHRGGNGCDQDNVSGSSVKRMSATAKEVIRKYLKKVKPLYEKISQKQQQQQLQKLGRLMTVPASASTTNAISFSLKSEKTARGADRLSGKNSRKDGNNNGGGFSHSFSGNLRYPRRKSCISSCPSSIRSSPSHSGVLCRPGFGGGRGGGGGGGGTYNFADASSMEELQSAIQGAIAHCKNSLAQNSNKTMVSNEI